MRHLRLLMTLSALMVAASAGVAGPTAAGVKGGGGGGGPCTALGRGPALSMQDACFDGKTHLVEPGTTIEVRNDGETTHDVTAADGSFASGPVAPGDTFEVTIDEPAIVPVYCTLHGTIDGAGMAGVLVVGDPTAAGTASWSPSDGPPETALASATAPAGRDGHAAVLLSAAAFVIAGVALVLGFEAFVRRSRPDPDTAAR